MRDESTSASALANLLAWYQAMGVDAVATTDAVDWFARGPEAPGRTYNWPDPASKTQSPPGDMLVSPAPVPAAVVLQPAKPGVVERPVAVPVRPDAAKPSTRPAGVAAATLQELEAALKSFDGCGLKATATKLCFFRGAASSRLMIIGEAPGRDEDLEGRPFVGRAGQLLDKMLAAIGLAEDQVHITNIVYWRPPGNRTPSPQEALACRPFLERQTELVGPDFLLLLGGAAAKHILNTDDGIMRLRGKWHEVSLGGRSIRTMATLHPAYLLRTPAAKRQVWRDLLSVKNALNEEVKY